MRTSNTSKLVWIGLLFLSVLPFFNSCSKGDDGPVIPPTPTAEFYRLPIDGEEPFLKWVGVLGSTKVDDTADINGDAVLRINKNLVSVTDGKSNLTGKGSAAAFDFVYGIRNKDTIHSYTNVSLLNNPTLNVEDYIHRVSIYCNVAGATTTFWDEGQTIPGISFNRDGTIRSKTSTITDDEGNGFFAFYDTEKNRTLDSITVNPNNPDLEQRTFPNVTISDSNTDPKNFIFEFESGIGAGIAFAITPTINEVNAVYNATITATSIDSPEYTYTQPTTNDQAIFEDVAVSGPYQITIASNEEDPIFFTTIDTVEVSSSEDKNFIIDVDKVQNEQDITMYVREFDNLNQFVSNYTVELQNADTGAVIATATTDGNGQILFENIPGETNIQVVGSKLNYYTKTNETHPIPFVDRVSEADITLNVLANQKINYLADGKPVEAEIINWYLPRQDNTQMAKDELIIFFPEADQQDTAIEHLTNAASLVGLTNFVAYDELSQFQGYPSGEMISQYNPFPGGETFPGLITTNVTSYFGTATGNAGKLLSNGRIANIYTTTFNLGGTEALDHHEFGNLNWPLIDGNITLSNGEFFITSRSPLASEIVQIDESKWDETLMPYTLQMQKNHYTQTDSEGRPIEYSMPTKFE
ncbi:carboxypeptidase regulatory-like domain-containing protein [Maribacter arenosus]|uniref:Carboxypeptidase regulatory-like domain-containing protein n=1 Tax=Maribacter arenosus TaxID=1854708 RepID=A0ABR7V9N6_9FLAO|nr:carboxypeptidase regulatory-like domain-containing protein [Maribacter arenosus]MBD0849616.1 carboxypeptidase regulatory-like domain-containing protein [Maribacter arenosus]